MKLLRWCICTVLIGFITANFRDDQSRPKASVDVVQQETAEGITLLRRKVWSALESSAEKFHAKLIEIDHINEEMKFHFAERAKPSMHHHYKKLHPVQDKNIKHKIVIAMKMKNMDKIKEILNDVSNPFSANYGKHLTSDEVAKLTRNPTSVNHVLRFLKLHNLNIVDRTLNDEFITVEAPIHVLDKLLNTKFFEYEVKSNPEQRLIRTEEYYLPSYLSEHVSAIFNTVHFPSPNVIVDSLPTKKVIHPESISLQSNILPKYVTPALINQVYQIPSNIGNSLASQAVYETIDQTFSPADLEKFQTRFQLTVEGVSHVIGGHSSDKVCKKDGGDDCIEANLDIQYLMAVAQRVPSTYYYWSGKDFMVEWLVQVSKMEHPPLVFSISYGSDESELPDSYGATFDEVAIRLSVRGVTLVASSGDDGAISSNARKNSLYCGYAPSFPASSPYVVAVGGTMGPENGNAEVVCQADNDGDITSGGGFSTIYKVPDWQKNATSSYFAKVSGTKNEPMKGYNKNGRGIPDISLLAHNYVIVLGGNYTAVSGTSASSPVFAGMISLVNSFRLQNGKSALGWVNPALYQLGHLFTRDVTEGNNNCVASGTVCCQQGFTAVEGWDPTTGLGSIDFPSFYQTLVGLGNNFNRPTMRPSPGPGQPSMNPTKMPVQVPTVAPSNAPTMGPGWFYLKQYQLESCEGPVITVSAVPSEKCMIAYDKDKKSIGSRKYSCLEDSVLVSYFSDTACGQNTVVAEEKYYFGCAYKVEDYYYATSYYSTELLCTQRTDVPPLPSLDGTYAVQSSYDDPTGCAEGKVSSVDATLQRHCFDMEGEGLSYKIIFPKVYLYTGSGCRKLKSSDDLSTQCEEEDLEGYSYYDDDGGVRRRKLGSHENADLQQDYGDDDFDTGFVGLYSKWSDGHYSVVTSSSSPTLVPTTLPSISPVLLNTSSPTILPTAIPTAEFSTNPTLAPSASPTQSLTDVPTLFNSPTSIPTYANTSEPSASPTISPTASPTAGVTYSANPTIMPTLTPTITIQSGSSEEEDDNKSKIPTIQPTVRLATASPYATPIIPPTANPTTTIFSNPPTATSGSSSSSSDEEDEKSKKPTAAPTARPTIGTLVPTILPTPTASPTLSDNDYKGKGEVKMKVDQILYGISIEIWKSDPDGCFLILQKTIVAANPFVQFLDVKLINVNPYNKDSVQNFRLLQSSQGVNVTYELVLDSKKSNFANAGEAFESVKETLITSVESGKFDDLLFATATKYQVSSMLGVTSATVAVVGVETLTSNSGDSAGTSKLHPALTGFVVGIGFSAVIFASIIYYFQSKKQLQKRGSSYNELSIESDSTHSNINPMSAKVVDEDEEIEIELTQRTGGYGLVKNPISADSTHGLV